MNPNVIDNCIKLVVRQLAETEVTPFYLFDLDGIRQRFIDIKKSWSKYFSKLHIAYSYKTNSLKAITRLLMAQGASAEVVTGSELQWACEDGFNTDNIFFDGPVKLEPELQLALKLGVRIQVDSLDELALITDICRTSEYRPKVSVRMACDYFSKGLSRFGLTSQEYRTAVRKLAEVGYEFSG